MRCCLSEKPLYCHRNGQHTGKVAEKKAINDGALTGSSSAVITEKTASHVRAGLLHREALHWAVTTGGFDSETVQDVMLSVERRFGNELPASPVE